MKLHKIIDTLEELAPLAYAESFDNVGLLVGDFNQIITGILVAHDALENVVNEAINKNCNLIVCFHPIIFSGIKRFTGADYVQRAVQKAIKNDIAIYAIHTALDNMPDGVSHTMCKALNLTKTSLLINKTQHLQKLVTYTPNKQAQQVREALFKAGAGKISDYKNCSFSNTGEGTFTALDGANPYIGKVNKLHTEPETRIEVIFEKHKQQQLIRALHEAHVYEEVAYQIINIENPHPKIGMGMVGYLKHPLEAQKFIELIKNTFKTGGVRHSELLTQKIEKVAVLGGSGAFAIQAAKKSGAQAYVTADLKYHDYYQAEGQILLADVGHYESERFTKAHIADYLSKKISNFAIILSAENTNPINYS